MLRDHPLLGVGLDNFAYLYGQSYLRAGAVAEPNLSHPHNWVLNVWLELGLLGLIAFVWLVVRFWTTASSSKGWLAAGAMGAMADMLVHGLIDNSYFLVDLAFIFWLIFALSSSVSAAMSYGSGEPAAPLRRPFGSGEPAAPRRQSSLASSHSFPRRPPA
jgi:O-antigen ligase